MRYKQRTAVLILTGLIGLCSSKLSLAELSDSMNPRQAALLLPLTGPLAGPGNAIKEGFLAAMQADPSQADAPEPLFYDTAKESAAQAYSRAVSEGAGFIIGPLTKAETSSIAAMEEHPVPSLLLNFTHDPQKANVFQFGLSPAFEANLLAEKAASQHLHQALVIAPRGPWGEEIAEAFKTGFTQHGGQVIASLFFEQGQDLDSSIRDFLGIRDAERRCKAIKEKLGSQIEAIPQRRQDFDLIFIQAYPSQARQIIPLLHYYYVQNLPIYASSSIYSGQPDPAANRDLNGILFADMPYLFRQQKSNKVWPESLNHYNRLFALGADSYLLMQNFEDLIFHPEKKLNGKTGELSINQNQQIHAEPQIGRFRQGLVELAGPREFS